MPADTLPRLSSRLLVLRVLLLRAIVAFLSLQLVLIIQGLLARQVVSASGSFDSPLGNVILVSVLGMIDVRVRKERMLWANLGFSSWHTTGVFTAVAIVGECAVLVAS